MDDLAEDTPARIYLQPIASPNVLGLYALGASVFVYGAWMAGWYGSEGSPGLMFPFLALFGGLAQFLAGMWAFRARDSLAAIVFTAAGSFWLAYGLLHLTSVLSEAVAIPPGGFSELGFWLIPLAVIAAVATAAATARSIVLTVTFGAFALSVAVLAIGQLTGSDPVLAISGWLLVISGLIAAYTASALLLADAMDRELLPLVTTSGMGRVDRGLGEPGVVHGDWVSDGIAHQERRRSEPQWEFQWPVRRRAA
ncbi:MAG: acetate uptake transporter [Dehalococcoidia bacterium]